MSGLDVADGLSTGSEQVMLVCPLLAQSGHASAHRNVRFLPVSEAHVVFKLQHRAAKFDH
jgi:hypothetical protein